MHLAARWGRMMTDARPTNVASRLQPPLIAIDHILVNRYLTATSLQRFQVAGTDHLGLMATIAGAG